jgi:hypothetical protein
MAIAAKNLAISPAGVDLGMGVMEQLSDEEEARRKQLMQARNPLLSMGGGVQGVASLDLFGAGGPR